ncbi:hypothetical protein V5F77_28150 [Xanthobacter sp. DSM 24535]|uniref:DUF4376 domain-containing protein n=1 Tax=Roseixanthobacter psychrophilus TaxID=3119917 RepID=UPI003726C72C
MARFARLLDAVVVEIITPPYGFEIAEMIHADLLAHFVPCPADCELGAIFDGTAFAAPAPWSAPVPTKEAIIAALREACAAAILGGFGSAALGAPHTYPSQPTDQVNLLGSVAASLLPDLPADWSTPFWCADEAEVWAYRPHTIGQIQAAGAAGKAHVVACQERLQALSAAVADAASAEAAAAIVWSASDAG